MDVQIGAVVQRVCGAKGGAGNKEGLLQGMLEIYQYAYRFLASIV